MKSILALVVLAVFCIVNTGLVFAADAPSPATAPRKANFAVLSGTVTKIYNADPANIKIEVKNNVDQTIHTVQVTPWTNITKVTDISEIGMGEQVRIMSRKVDDQEVAMGVMFGKIKSMPAVPANAEKK